MRTRLVVLLVLAHRSALADPSPLGDAGESCRVHADCRPDLHCVDELCTSVKPGASIGFSLTDGKVHPFMGATLTGGFTIAGVTGSDPALGESTARSERPSMLGCSSACTS